METEINTECEGEHAAPENLVVRSLDRTRNRAIVMPRYVIEFSDQDTMPERLEQMASELDITVEELVHRFIADGMKGYGLDEGTIDAESLDEFLVKAGVRKPKK